jgi:hypothetical protein
MGGNNVAVLRLKSKGTQYWRAIKVRMATNESGFSALPGGYTTMVMGSTHLVIMDTGGVLRMMEKITQLIRYFY